MPQIIELLDLFGEFSPGKLRAKRMASLGPLIERLVMGADDDFEEGEGGMATLNSAEIWTELLAQEKEWAKDVLIMSNRERAGFGRNFVDAVVKIHEVVFWKSRGSSSLWSRYETVLRGIWARILDQNGVYRPVNGKVRGMRNRGSRMTTSIAPNLVSEVKGGPGVSWSITMTDTQKNALEELKKKLRA